MQSTKRIGKTRKDRKDKKRQGRAGKGNVRMRMPTGKDKE